jgi:hypothetical protein
VQQDELQRRTLDVGKYSVAVLLEELQSPEKEVIEVDRLGVGEPLFVPLVDLRGQETTQISHPRMIAASAEVTAKSAGRTSATMSGSSSASDPVALEAAIVRRSSGV